MFKRTFTIQAPKNRANENTYRELTAILGTTLQGLLCASTAHFESWPDIAWEGEQGSIQAHEWTAENSEDTRMLTIQMRLRQAGLDWLYSLQVGCTTPEEVIWQEECRLNPTPAQFPVLSIPNLQGCLSQFDCYDLDGMRTGVAYSINKNKLAKFQGFLEAPGEERRLPILLVSPQAGIFPFSVEYRALAKALCGIAHVMYLDAKHTWEKREACLQHNCYNGAVRIYWPGYSRENGWKVHPFWLPSEHRIKREDQERMLNEAVTVHAATAVEHPTLVQLRRRMRDEEANQRLRELIQLNRQQVTVQEETKWVEFFDSLQSGYDSLVCERDFLRAENVRLHDEVRALHFRLNTQWTVTETPAATTGDGLSHPTMSERAADTYLGLDGSELEQIDKLLERFLRAQARTSQCDSDHFVDGGPCYIYPRSRTGSGRRILYLLNGAEVRICEIYTCHDTYERARTTGWRKADYQNANPWSPLAPDTTQLTLPINGSPA